MAIPLIINGVTFQYPQQFDKNWAPTLTNWSSAVTSGMLQKAGGSFTLTAEVDFGGSFGMKVLSIKSAESNIATTGVLRMANASTGVVWRNALHNADLALTVNASNQLTFNGTAIGATTSLTDGHILVGNVSNQPADVAMSGDITITNAGATAIGAGKVLNANVNASAAIAWSKLATGTPYRWLTLDSGGVIVGTGVTASKAVASDSNGLPVASSTTATELGYVAGVTSAIQTQIDGKVSKSGDTMTGVLNMGSNKITSLAVATAASDAVAFNQLRYFQTVQSAANTTATTTTSTTYVDTHLSLAFTPTSAAHRVKLTVSTVCSISTANERIIYGINRGSTHLSSNGFSSVQSSGIATPRSNVSFTYIDSPATTAPITYAVEIMSGAGGTVIDNQGNDAYLIAEEIL